MRRLAALAPLAAALAVTSAVSSAHAEGFTGLPFMNGDRWIATDSNNHRRTEQVVLFGQWVAAIGPDPTGGDPRVFQTVTGIPHFAGGGPNDIRAAADGSLYQLRGGYWLPVGKGEVITLSDGEQLRVNYRFTDFEAINYDYKALRTLQERAATSVTPAAPSPPKPIPSQVVKPPPVPSVMSDPVAWLFRQSPADVVQVAQVGVVAYLGLWALVSIMRRVTGRRTEAAARKVDPEARTPQAQAAAAGN